jgi:GT2 family glycosyltransferase
MADGLPSEFSELVVLIPTYNPTDRLDEPAQLTQLATTVTASGSPLVISDDASSCTSDPLLRALPASRVIRHTYNKGIARGLNDGLQAAVDMRATWLLTLDQDSRIDANYIPTLKNIADSLNKQLWSDNPPVGAVAPMNVTDDSGTITYPTREVGSLTVTEEVIQSGTIWNVKALTEVGGFDERLGIDAVDSAACLRLREAGYVIALTPDVTFHHSLGAARQINILGRSVMVTGHSVTRRGSIIRNRLRLAPAEFKQSPTHAFRTLRRVAVNEVLGWALPPKSK